MDTIKVSLYGPTGSGKTVLFAAMMNYLTKSNDYTITSFSPQATGVNGKLAALNWPDPTPPEGNAEEICYSYRNEKEFKVISHAGEAYIRNNEFNIDSFLQEYRKSGCHVFIAVVNPFLSDVSLAFKGFRNLVARIQSSTTSPISFGNACKITAKTMFGRDDMEALNIPGLNKLLQHDSGIVLRYDHNPVDVEQRFQFDPDNREINVLIKQAISTIVQQRGLYFHALKAIATHIPNLIAVLTHIDLLDFMPCICVNDLDPIFNGIFGYRRDRSVRQQVCAPLLLTGIRNPQENINLHPVFIRGFSNYSWDSFFDCIKTLGEGELSKRKSKNKIFGLIEIR